MTTLSARQQQILELRAEGRTHRWIAKTLGIDETTVAHHMTHLLTALGARDCAHAVAIGFRQGLLTPSGDHIPLMTVVYDCAKEGQQW